jgi:GNAT superfamily N-acetyltransferase
MIRHATPADLEALQSIFEQASRSNAGDRADLADHPAARIFARLDDPTFRCRVAPAAAEVGLVGLATTTRADHVVELGDLFVNPEYMRQGMARSLLDDGVVQARATGARRLEVNSYPHAQAVSPSVGLVVEPIVATQFGPGPRLGRSLQFMVTICSPDGRRAIRAYDATRR